VSSSLTFPIHRLFHPSTRTWPSVTPSKSATYLYHKRIPYKIVPEFDSPSRCTVTFWRSFRSLRVLPIPLRINDSRFYACLPLNIVSLLKSCLPPLANTCLPTEDCKQLTWCVTFIHVPGNLFDHPWVRYNRQMFHGLLHPCSRRRSSCRKCYDSGAYRVQQNSTLATSTYALEPNSTRP
jgi:hypothetical protein